MSSTINNLQKIVPTGSNARNVGDLFSHSVNVAYQEDKASDIHSGSAIVGAHLQNFDEAGLNSLSDAGAAYLFVKTGSVWSQQQKIVPTGTNARNAGDEFGNAVSIYEDTCAVGAVYHQYDESGANPLSEAGAVWIYTRTGSVWSQQQKIVPTD